MNPELTACPSGERVLRGGDRSESDPRLPWDLFLGGERSESEPLPPWPLFLGGDRSKSEPRRPWGRLRGGDWSESEFLPFRTRLLGGKRSSEEAAFVFFLFGDSEITDRFEPHTVTQCKCCFWFVDRFLYLYHVAVEFWRVSSCGSFLEGKVIRTHAVCFCSRLCVFEVRDLVSHYDLFSGVRDPVSRAEPSWVRGQGNRAAPSVQEKSPVNHVALYDLCQGPS